MKYIFITGGVVSGLGKGITAAALGRLLKARGVEVKMQKFDPYLNIDPGVMSPIQHGEVFVTDDGAEADIDVGHYERFIDDNLDVNADVTAGQVYWSVLNQEREGRFNGGTVQVIPHITNEIKRRIKLAGKAGADVIISEIGGTVGDIESQPFLEAARQLSIEEGHENVLFIHVSLIVFLNGNELKSKPTQHSVKELLGLGIQPDILVCRTDMPLTKEMRAKIALFCNVPADCVIQNTTAGTLYEVPLLLEAEGLDSVVCRRLSLPDKAAELTEWRAMIDALKACEKTVEIGLVGKYTALHDAYLSVGEALRHAGVANGTNVNIHWIKAEHINANSADKHLGKLDGILVPYGFGPRGTDGKMAAVRYARERGIPFFGVSMGMQAAVIEFARNVCGLAAANSTEMDKNTPVPVVHTVPESPDKEVGPMRLGLCRCALAEGSLARRLYGQEEIAERHRHRYEINAQYRGLLEEHGMVFSGVSPDGEYIEMAELPGHPFYITTQGLPEFRSRPNRPHPLYVGFIAAALKSKEELL